MGALGLLLLMPVSATQWAYCGQAYVSHSPGLVGTTLKFHFRTWTMMSAEVT